MWTAELKNKTITDDVLTFVVEYKNGKDVVSKTYVSNNPNFDIKAQARNEIDKLSRVSTKFSSTKLGNIDTTKPTPEPTPEPTPPTAQELAQQAYQSKKMELMSLKADLDLGLVTQADYDKVLNETKLLLTATKG